LFQRLNDGIPAAAAAAVDADAATGWLLIPAALTSALLFQAVRLDSSLSGF